MNMNEQLIEVLKWAERDKENYMVEDELPDYMKNTSRVIRYAEDGCIEDATLTNKEQMVRSMKIMLQAMRSINECWHKFDATDESACADNYPFLSSFDNLIEPVEKWVSTVTAKLSLRPDHEIRMKFAKNIADANEETFETFGDACKCIGFDYYGQHIHNPWMDDTGRFEVDPIEYYGEAFLNSKFYKYED